MDRGLEIKPIAVFRSPFGTKFGVPRQSSVVPELRGSIHFEAEYRHPDALRGLEGFDWLWLIWGFSANANSPATFKATVRPPRLGGNIPMGVFATRSPFRPNPLGLSSVRIESIDMENMVINVLGADLMDGTPIYDIKPYIAYTDSHPEAEGGFTSVSSWPELAVMDPSGLLDKFSEGDKAAVTKVLAQDPRPHYKSGSDPKKYGCLFMGKDIRFTVSDGILTVVEID